MWNVSCCSNYYFTIVKAVEGLSPDLSQNKGFVALRCEVGDQQLVDRDFVKSLQGKGLEDHL